MPVIDVWHGTPETAWLACDRLVALPEFDWRKPCRVIVIAPHPDDETLGVGGTLCALARIGCEIDLVALTDGEASHPHSPGMSPARLAAMRARERTHAMLALELRNIRIITLRLRDGRLSQIGGLAELLSPLVCGADYCFAPFRYDGHPDHDASGAAAAQACEASGVTLCEYPIWAWQWAHPDSDALPWPRARRLPLVPFARQAKGRAIRAYRSQVEPLTDAAEDRPVLPQAVLDHFSRDFEVVFV